MYKCYFSMRKRISINKSETAKKLKQLREENNYSIRDIQNYLNIQSSQSIYNWETPDSKSLPSIEHAILLANLYHVHIDDLIVFELIDEEITDVKESGANYYIDSKDKSVFQINCIPLEEYLDNQAGK